MEQPVRRETCMIIEVERNGVSLTSSGGDSMIAGWNILLQMKLVVFHLYVYRWLHIAFEKLVKNFSWDPSWLVTCDIPLPSRSLDPQSYPLFPGAMAALSQQEIKTLEQTRQRLFQLSNSLASLQHNILQSDPLPSW